MVSSHYYSHELQLPLITCCSDPSTPRTSISVSQILITKFLFKILNAELLVRKALFERVTGT